MYLGLWDFVFILLVMVLVFRNGNKIPETVNLITICCLYIGFGQVWT